MTEINNILYAARSKRLNEALISLSNWCLKRAEENRNPETTLTMLRHKMEEIPDSVNRAGWAAIKSLQKEVDELNL